MLDDWAIYERPAFRNFGKPSRDGKSDIFCQRLFHSVSTCATMREVRIRNVPIFNYSRLPQGREVGI
jgi:hypothetical protein